MNGRTKLKDRWACGWTDRHTIKQYSTLCLHARLCDPAQNGI